MYVDGPHSVFSIDPDKRPGFGLIAMRSGHSRPDQHAADDGRSPGRPHVALPRDVAVAAITKAANREWGGGPIAMSSRGWRPAQLTVVHVFERPPDDWAGDAGYVTAEILARHLPPGRRRFQFFIRGPDPMMEAALIGLGVPPERVHIERFDML